MSTKQISRAATDGRKLAFNTMSTSVVGYVVGMDDYHWLVMNLISDTLALVHKGSTPTVIFMEEMLAGEGDDLQERVREVGQPFWDSLKENR